MQQVASVKPKAYNVCDHDQFNRYEKNEQIEERAGVNEDDKVVGLEEENTVISLI